MSQFMTTSRSFAPEQKLVAASPEVKQHGWPASKLRMLALSASLPNIAEVADWLGATAAGTVSALS